MLAETKESILRILSAERGKEKKDASEREESTKNKNLTALFQPRATFDPSFQNIGWKGNASEGGLIHLMEGKCFRGLIGERRSVLEYYRWKGNSGIDGKRDRWKGNSR